MQECSNPQAPNTCIPYLLSLIIILQRHLDHLSGQDLSEENEEKIQTVPSESLSSTNKEKGMLEIVAQLREVSVKQNEHQTNCLRVKNKYFLF